MVVASTWPPMRICFAMLPWIVALWGWGAVVSMERRRRWSRGAVVLVVVVTSVVVHVCEMTMVLILQMVVMVMVGRVPGLLELVVPGSPLLLLPPDPRLDLQLHHLDLAPAHLTPSQPALVAPLPTTSRPLSCCGSTSTSRSSVAS